MKKIKDWIEDKMYLVVETTAMAAMTVFIIVMLILLIISLVGLVKVSLGT